MLRLPLPFYLDSVNLAVLCDCVCQPSHQSTDSPRNYAVYLNTSDKAANVCHFDLDVCRILVANLENLSLLSIMYT